MSPETRQWPDDRTRRVERWLEHERGAIPTADPRSGLGPVFDRIAREPSPWAESAATVKRRRSITAVAIALIVVAAGSIAVLLPGPDQATSDAPVVGAASTDTFSNPVPDPIAASQDGLDLAAVPRSDLLAGATLETVVIEPGVSRVVSDGHGPVSRTAVSFTDSDETMVIAGEDGSLWLLEPRQRTVRRLGDPAARSFRGLPRQDRSTPALVVDGSGRAWLRAGGGSGLHTWTTDGWRRRLAGDVGPISAGRDGSIVAARTSQCCAGREVEVFRFSEGDRTKLPLMPPGKGGPGSPVQALGVDSTGTVFAIRRDALYRFDGTRWSTFPLASTSAGRAGSDARVIEAVLDGRRRTFRQGRNRSWHEITPATPTTDPFSDTLAPAHRAIGRDGTVWRSVERKRPVADRCGGVAGSSGPSWQTYLDGHCVLDLVPGSDGTVWARAFSVAEEPLSDDSPFSRFVFGDIELFAIETT